MGDAMGTSAEPSSEASRMSANVIPIGNRAKRRRAKHNREVAADAVQVMAVIMTAKRALLRDGTPTTVVQPAFCEDPTEAKQRECVGKLLDWAYNHGSIEESRGSNVARILSPEANVIYRAIKDGETGWETWNKLFVQLAKDGVTFKTETREMGPK